MAPLWREGKQSKAADLKRAKDVMELLHSPGSSNEDWGKVLDSYESYIDQYIKLLKKANNGNLSAMTEYASVMEKAIDLSNKMPNAGSELSTTQTVRFMKMQTKLANAAANL